MSSKTQPGPLILASTSPARGELLRCLGLEFTQVDPGVDEGPLQALETEPLRLASSLALAKARAVGKKNPQAYVIGGDQVCAIEGELLHKPLSRERAVEQLMRLTGRTHQLVTATAVLAPGESTGDNSRVWTEVAQMTMTRLDRPALERSVDRDDPLYCAGSYKLEQGGIALFERIECEDWNGIVGLPLIRLAACLRKLGFELP